MSMYLSMTGMYLAGGLHHRSCWKQWTSMVSHTRYAIRVCAVRCDESQYRYDKDRAELSGPIRFALPSGSDAWRGEGTLLERLWKWKPESIRICPDAMRTAFAPSTGVKSSTRRSGMSLLPIWQNACPWTTVSSLILLFSRHGIKIQSYR